MDPVGKQQLETSAYQRHYHASNYTHYLCLTVSMAGCLCLFCLLSTKASHSSDSATASHFSTHSLLSDSALLNRQYSAEEEEWFQTWYEEGYDLFDPKYVSWLELHHPEAVPADCYLSPAVDIVTLLLFFSRYTL